MSDTAELPRVGSKHPRDSMAKYAIGSRSDARAQNQDSDQRDRRISALEAEVDRLRAQNLAFAFPPTSPNIMSPPAYDAVRR
jgi:hypothetical protein